MRDPRAPRAKSVAGMAALLARIFTLDLVRKEGRKAFLRSSGMQFAFVNLAPPVQILVVDEKREERRAARVPSQSERDF